jgi:NAD(P)-dependent dehydrogenase (short-subunit alcohol dehydrogenase family)
LTFAIDVTQPDSVASTYAAVHAALQRIDYAVQCAGVITFDAPSADCALETFDRDNAINYRGLWLCTREAIRLMRRQGLDCDAYPHAGIPAYRAQRGAIVNLSSGMALRHQRNCSVYSASKAAVLALSRGDGVDYAADRIRVNAVLPGLVDSPMTAAVDAERRKFLEDRVRDVVPSKRFGRPEEIADVCLFLVSTQASYVTAAAWSVDGGRGGV